MKLVIIEGPGKVETLKKYLGSDYEVIATKGHVRDLPIKELGIDFNNDFAPKYDILPDKKDVVSDLKKKANKADVVLLATDPDREGEAISWHIAYILGITPDKKCRVVFNEISEDVVKKAVQDPRAIDQSIVDAQQARRVLDRIVGYKLSPIICKKIKPKLSAGRVQSVALKLVVDREKEIKGFVPEEYWNVFAYLNKDKDSMVFKTNLATYNGKKIKPKSKEETDAIISDIKDQTFSVSKIKKSVIKSHAPAPFTTSTMQQDALNKLSFDLGKTSRVAQVLYEGVSLGNEGKHALITYIRTDSTRVSQDAQNKARAYIGQVFGNEFVPAKPNSYASKANAQDAHEAIRPISMNKTPESIKNLINPDAYKLYKLIYDRFLASQMSEAVYNNVSLDCEVASYGFKANGKTLVFSGWTSAYKGIEEKKDDADDNVKIPVLKDGEKLLCKEIKTEQKFTKPPQRFTEATLVKMMEEKGIGRPATYAPTITTLSQREYTKKENKFLIPTELGTVVEEYLEKNFNSIMDVEFTAKMESTLDSVADGGKDWHQIIEKFWKHFAPYLKSADTSSVVFKVPAEMTDIVCDKCGAKMVIREGKYGKFLGCSNYPKCTNMQKIDKGPKKALKEVSVCPDCGKPVVLRRSKKGKIFYGCSAFPACKFVSWDKPTGEKCPKCSAFLVYENAQKEDSIKCSKCDYKTTK